MGGWQQGCRLLFPPRIIDQEDRGENRSGQHYGLSMQGGKPTYRWGMKLRWLPHKALLLFLCGLLASGCGLNFAPEVTPTHPPEVALAVTATAIKASGGNVDRGDV